MNLRLCVYPKSFITTLIFPFRLGNKFPRLLQPLAGILHVVFQKGKSR